MHEKSITDISKKRYKKSFFRRSGEKQVLKIIKTKQISSFLFYTDVDNILFTLEYGIVPVEQKKQLIKKEYSVWTYLEKENSIGLEFDNSTRVNFWEWAKQAEVNVDQIAVIGIDPIKLSKYTTYDWTYDANSKITYINEAISLEAIEWILIKDKVNYERIKTFIEANDLEIRVFYGESGNII